MTFTEDEEAMAVVIREKEPIGENFELGCHIAWNQPMFTHHDTFIIGFSHAKKHMAAASNNSRTSSPSTVSPTGQ
ncbi:hypothetical protein [Corynebacterium endometrii]|uniref:Uncharacterized protein n=1 Tax=Corynebacterium endometrii TaxID=2488819 RepID=A0A4P7QJD1_9CORY|nr:hypothetical protein [Corynebacterium endometrii]QCB29216.1 hypothetical protein CENDO_09810 [Corynebacterium endometrii]